MRQITKLFLALAIVASPLTLLAVMMIHYIVEMIIMMI